LTALLSSAEKLNCQKTTEKLKDKGKGKGHPCSSHEGVLGE